MRYVSILLGLAVLCLIAAPAIGVADAKGPAQNGAQTGPADGSGAQLGNGPNGAQTGDQDGSGPDRDGSCQTST
ncbi:MAG: hypothetical protein PHQ34_06270 [Methanothrix sp.]|nr:hypothetical protein [Methanothrix sp.]